jgi:hypothetical protein
MSIEETRLKVNPRTLRRINPDHRKRDTPEYLTYLSWLGNDMANRGQRQDVLVCSDPDNVDRVLDGQTRCDAASLCGLDVWIRRITVGSRGEQIGETYLGNTAHRDFDRVEEMAYWQELLVANNWTRSQLAKAIGKSESIISKRLSLHAKASEHELALLVEKDEKKRLPIRALESLVRHFDNAADRKPWIDKMLNGLLTCDSLEAELAKLKVRRNGKKSRMVKMKFPNGSVLYVPADIEKEKLASDINLLDSLKKRADKDGLPYSVMPSLMTK